MHWGPLGHFCGVEGETGRRKEELGKAVRGGRWHIHLVFLDIRGLGATAPVVTRCRAEERARAHAARGSIPTAEVCARLSWARPQVGAFPGPGVCAGGPGLMEGPAPRGHTRWVSGALACPWHTQGPCDLHPGSCGGGAQRTGPGWWTGRRAGGQRSSGSQLELAWWAGSRAAPALPLAAVPKVMPGPVGMGVA